MADLGRWFKLWCAAVDDPDLDNLDIADFGRWAKLGAYIKEHGIEGELTLSEPCKTVVSMMQLSTFNDVFQCVKKFPNVTVSSVTNTPVSFFIKYQNWHKYQGDFSTDRVKKFRDKKRKSETPKKRGEEKRGEENKKEVKERVSAEPKPASRAKNMSDEEWLLSLKSNPAYKGLMIEVLYQKMRVWCETNGKKPTRRRFVNWLNREERPMTDSCKSMTDTERYRLKVQLKEAYEFKKRAEESLEFRKEQGNEAEVKRLTGNIKAYEQEIARIEKALK